MAVAVLLQVYSKSFAIYKFSGLKVLIFSVINSNIMMIIVDVLLITLNFHVRRRGMEDLYTHHYID